MQNNVRIIHKHAVEAVWNSKTTFIPYSGEFVVYDPDDAHSYARFKIGDGVSTIIQLPFSKSETATTADKLTTSRVVKLVGDITGYSTFDGSSDLTLVTTLAKSFSAEFTGTEHSHSHVFKGDPVTLQISHNPQGYVELNYTPEGTISAPQIHVTPVVKQVSVLTDDGPVSTYTPGSCIFPELTGSADETTGSLVLELTGGVYTPGSYAHGGSAIRTQLSYVESVSVKADAPEFTGTAATLRASLSGIDSTTTVQYTPTGIVEETSMTPSGVINIIQT